MTKYLKTKLVIKKALEHFDDDLEKVSEILFNVYREEMDAIIDAVNQNFTHKSVLKNSENTTSVSDARTKSGVLHDVGESHASGQTDNDSLASGELPLEKITDDGNNFYCEFGKGICSKQCDKCRLDNQYLD